MMSVISGHDIEEKVYFITTKKVNIKQKLYFVTTKETKKVY